MNARRNILIAEGKVLLGGARDALPEGDFSAYADGGARFTIGDCTASGVAAEAASAAGLSAVGVRDSYTMLPREDYRLVAKAAELVYWDRETRFCRFCGSPLEQAGEICRRCARCGREYFPQMTPAIIVLVRKGEEALLVRARNFSRPFFGLVAGFVETGESLEECVAREVMEETSLRIGNIRYFGSQSWPFPSQLMIAFTADWISGEVRFADGELADGGFFRRDSLPELASPPSIARMLIEDWMARGPGADGAAG